MSGFFSFLSLSKFKFWRKEVIRPEKAIDNLCSVLVSLEEREALLEKQISEHRRVTKCAIKEKNKQKTLHLLRKLKLCEKQIGTIWNTKLAIETHIATLAQTIINSEVISAIRAAKDSIIHFGKIDPEKVSAMMDEIDDKIADINEVSDSLFQNSDATNDNENDELLTELKAEITEEEKEKNGEKKIKFPVVPNNPRINSPVPVRKKRKQEVDEEII